MLVPIALFRMHLGYDKLTKHNSFPRVFETIFKHIYLIFCSIFVRLTSKIISWRRVQSQTTLRRVIFPLEMACCWMILWPIYRLNLDDGWKQEFPLLTEKECFTTLLEINTKVQKDSQKAIGFGVRYIRALRPHKTTEHEKQTACDWLLASLDLLFATSSTISILLSLLHSNDDWTQQQKLIVLQNWAFDTSVGREKEQIHTNQGRKLTKQTRTLEELAPDST